MDFWSCSTTYKWPIWSIILYNFWWNFGTVVGGSWKAKMKVNFDSQRKNMIAQLRFMLQSLWTKLIQTIFAFLAGHPWVQVDGVAPDKPLASAVLSRLKQFSAMNKLKKMAIRVSARVMKASTCAILGSFLVNEGKLYLLNTVIYMSLTRNKCMVFFQISEYVSLGHIENGKFCF